MISYYSSKAGVNHFTRAVAVEYASKGIRCNAVLPGLINTPMIVEPYMHVYDSVDDMIAKCDAMVPMGKMGTAWDVAHASLFHRTKRNVSQACFCPSMVCSRAELDKLA